MGICLALCQIDHEGVIVRGLPLVDHAIRSGDLAPLRNHINALRFDESAEQSDRLQELVAALRAANAPEFLIKSSQQRLASTRRPDPMQIDRATPDELRELLGSWCREARTVDLDKAWDLIHWFADPARRERADGDWRGEAPAFAPSPFDWAIHGHEHYPRDAKGCPIVKSAGNPDMSRYNPPEVVAEVAKAIERVAVADWPAIDEAMQDLAPDALPYLGDCEDRLDYAMDAFGRLAGFYRSAASRQFGVSVEFY